MSRSGKTCRIGVGERLLGGSKGWFVYFFLTPEVKSKLFREEYLSTETKIKGYTDLEVSFSVSMFLGLLVVVFHFLLVLLS